MRISTRGRYALRMMQELAVNYSDAYIPLRQVALSQGISDKYLEQIIPTLVRAGLLLSSRGAFGGYRLSRPPEEITVGMVLRNSEGSFSPVPCTDDGCDACPRADECVTVDVWRAIKDAIDGVVDSITLADMALMYQKRTKAHGSEN